MAPAEVAERPPVRSARDLRARSDLRGGGTELRTGPDLAELAADWIARRAEGRDRFRIALTGGSTPRVVYERLAEFPLAWEKWEVWWSDERLVPPDHRDSNERMAREALLERVPIPEAQIHPLRSVGVELPDRFDLILLGIGPDGHTASLYPGDRALEATEPLVRVERPGLPPYHPRLTFTYPLIDSAVERAFIVGGAEKRDVLARVLAGDRTLPAARVRANGTFVLADDAAAPRGATLP